MNPLGDVKEDIGATAAGPSSILVVDDEVMIQTLLAGLLTEEGYLVTTAADGQEAIDLLERERFDLVITDVVMPGPDGTDVLLAARRIDPACPVIMITGYPSVDTAVRLVNLGATEYITKPFNVDLIKLTVAKVLEMTRVREAANEVGSYMQFATIDGPTETYNLALFKQLLEKEVERSEWKGHVCGVLTLEIDNFGGYPDNGSTRLGDEIVKKFVGILRSQTRPGDIIGRMGQAEFALILPETDDDHAQELGGRVRSKAEWNFTLSTGVACFPRDGSDAQTLIEKARAAKEASRSGAGARPPASSDY
jgi:diguanylate cyclase (GGDEF)-like protein